MIGINVADEIAVAGVIDPDAYAAATYTTAWIAMADFAQALAVLSVGDLGAAATVDAKFEQAQGASGTGAKDLTGAAITQLTQAGGDDNKQAEIAMNDDDLDVNNAFTHVRLSVTVAVATSDMGALVLGYGAHYGPASARDLASVSEIVRV